MLEVETSISVAVKANSTLEVVNILVLNTVDAEYTRTVEVETCNSET